MDFILEIGRGFLGIVAMIGICFLFSTNRKQIDWVLVVKGIALQLVIAFLMLEFAPVRAMFSYVVDFFVLMADASNQSAAFLFGDLAKPGGPYGFAFFVLPTIIFFSAASSLLYYFGILQFVVKGFGWVMDKVLGLSGAESLAAAANVFIGQTEAPLVVKPYLEGMSRSEIMCLMTGGMATIAGGVFGAYMSMLGEGDPAKMAVYGMHLLTASIISAPAAIVAAKILVPVIKDATTEDDTTNQKLVDEEEVLGEGDNFLDALARGTIDGLRLAANVGAMLLAFMALIYFSNMVLFEIGEKTALNALVAANSSYEGLSLQYLMGFLFSPVAWLIGIEWNDCIVVGQMLGEKLILNEFIAYDSLTKVVEMDVPTLSERSILITTYALCGFANFASIGIQIGGISAIAPGQREVLTELGLRALLGGTVACLLTACVAGMIV